MKALNLCQIIALPKDLKFLLINLRAAGVKINMIPVPGEKGNYRVLLNLQDQETIPGGRRQRIKEGSLKGLETCGVAYWDTEELDLLKVLKRLKMKSKILGETPGWASEPIYLFWQDQSYADLTKILEKNKALEDNKE